MLTAWATITPQPNPVIEFEARYRFVTTTAYLLAHLLGTTLGIILLNFGVLALGAYLVKSLSGRLGLEAMVTTMRLTCCFCRSVDGGAFGEPAIGQAYLSGIDEAL